jgi:hypothetical protein
MRYMNLNILFYFIQVLLRKRKHSIKDEHFSKHTLFIMIYLLPK